MRRAIAALVAVAAGGVAAFSFGSHPATEGAISAVETDELINAPPKTPETKALLVCNAYGAKEATFNQNGAMITKIPFRQCDKIDGKHVKAGESIEVVLSDGSSGVFNVPTVEDMSTLLIVVEKKMSKEGATEKMAFQSYNYHPNTNGQAQIALLDAFSDQAAEKVVSMKDHFGKSVDKDLARKERNQNLDMNHVYMVNEGEYETVMTERHGNHRRTAKMLLQFKNGGDYVLLRTGTDERDVQLVAYPLHEESHAAPLATTAALALFFLAW